MKKSLAQRRRGTEEEKPRTEARGTRTKSLAQGRRGTEEEKDQKGAAKKVPGTFLAGSVGRFFLL